MYPYIWSGNQLVSDAANWGSYDTTCYRNIVTALTGFSSTAPGKLTGPDGNEQDTEEFLASFTLWTTASTTCKSGSTYYDTSTAVARTYASSVVGNPVPLLFRVVTQKYGQGIVSGLTVSTSTTIPGGSYENICDANGAIYVEVDLSCPACIKCDSVDGYVCSYFASTALRHGGTVETPFIASWRQYYDLEFESAMGEVSFD